MFVDADHCQGTTRDFHDFIGLEPMSLNPDSNFNRTPAGAERLCEQTHAVANAYRTFEFDTMKGHSDPSMKTMTPGFVKACLVNEGEDDATENGSKGIRIPGHDLYTKGQVL